MVAGRAQRAARFCERDASGPVVAPRLAVARPLSVLNSQLLTSEKSRLNAQVNEREMKEILLLYLFTVMAAAIKQANIERSSCDETVLSDTSLDIILKECTEIQKDAEFLNRSDDLRQVMKHHSTRCMGAESCRCGVYSFLEAKSLKSAQPLLSSEA